ncbi:hypothetical protein NQ318_004936 [Aromia moschata]|uniref:Transposase n=1 Tax=Aromia moschata TaxID=1265417 RepID=A0AAV8Z284_9CUCU|nr:hypothetical protein NQ318_004936 [Aromia moschata]
MGHVRKVPSKRQAVVDDDTKLNLLLALEENTITPVRQLARDSNLNHKTVLKILKYEKKRPYKMQAVQELLEDDPDRRFSLTATFTLNGQHVNRQNCRYWAEENPHWMRELHTQRPQKTNVWAGIIQDRSVGPFFFNDTLNGARYLCTHKLVPSNELAEDDFDRRILFCEQVMQMIDDNTLQIKNVLFSDESTFTLHGHVNRQNCLYWSGENAYCMRELHTQNPEKVNVWAGIIGENIIGPFFIDGNLNGETLV